MTDEEIQKLLPEGDSLLPTPEVEPIDTLEGNRLKLEFIDPNKNRYGYLQCMMCGVWKKRKKTVSLSRCCCWEDVICNRCVKRRTLDEYLAKAGAC